MDTSAETSDDDADPAPADWPARMRARAAGGAATAWRIVFRLAAKSFKEGIFGRSAQAAFWQTLSLPPLLLGLLGALGYVGGLFGPGTVELIESKIVSASNKVFSSSVVNEIIHPTIIDILARGRGAIVSVGFVLSFWAGSSAISCFVDAIVEAHGQKDERHPVWQRVVALFLYLFFLVLGIITLPLVALGPTYIAELVPESWHRFGAELIDVFYYPAVGLLLLVMLTTLYKLALPRSLPWHRLLGGAVLAGIFFMIASWGLRFYLTVVVSRTGYSYGALATPIAFLLLLFFLGFSVVLGAQFNAVIQEVWPARQTRIDQLRDWLSSQSDALNSPMGSAVTAPLRRIASGPRLPRGLRRTSRGRPAETSDSEPSGAQPPDSAEPGPESATAELDGGGRNQPLPPGSDS